MIDTTMHGDVAVVTIEHGPVNALDVELLTALPDALSQVGDAPVVLTGAGRCFSAGVDLKRVVDGGAPYVAEFLPALSAAVLAVFDHPRPVVAAVNGHALAGGCVLACACDVRLMSSGTIGLTELSVGVPFPTVPLEVMRHAAGAALDRLVLTAARFSPVDAHRLGLVDEVVPDELLAAAVSTAADLGGVPPAVYASSKTRLREPAHARIAARRDLDDPGVAQAWGDPATLERLRDFLAGLAAR
ncbi:enoyl-CoA hydratase/isomerase family protein [Actinophytocola oryzae]|uniref:Enoyl-CoA hydratase n=1 Tax=Actinophytocola oryzae TaxID=502181 RepID=A0A4R7VY69_9PSEU|nr:enoyl-CoA hydratase/isomerase family protein [Actinophytocola oryzae]TDV55116.1 enoyl-CoA hydratase [Actinophytocola oryzae]